MSPKEIFIQRQIDLSDAEFMDRFNKCELSLADFFHEAHLRLAWINIDRLGIEAAEVEIQNHQ